MLAAVNRIARSLTPVSTYAIVVPLTVIVAFVDHLTGYELSFSIFYLLPVAVGAWFLRGAHIYVVCGACAVTWGIVDYTSGHIFSSVAIPLWNTAVRAGFFLIVAMLVSELRDALRLQETLARMDGLTGIANARAFKQACNRLCELSVRNSRPFAIGYIDLDNFKSVNDSLGHSTGDLVLKATADSLAIRLRVSDVCARLGGDEFAVLLPETDINGAKIVFGELHNRLVNFASRNHWPIGFSIGVAIFHLNKGDPDEIIRCADDLMYRVKRTGKNNVQFEEFDQLT